jgi:DNA-binding winged helix-turn-helix (wHTH) protein
LKIYQKFIEEKSKPMERRYLEFGPFRIDTAARLLMRGEETVPLTPKAFETLMALILRRGEVVERDELIRLVWRGTFVESGNLNSNIFMLRRALDDSDQRYISTVPRRGYRFVAEVKELSCPDEASPAGSIGVLPFRHLSDDGADKFLGLGMADALITKLSNIKQIVVRPTSAVRKYVDAECDPVAAGRELSVESIIEGTIRVLGDRMRVTVQMISVSESAPVWAEKFDEKFTDIFAVEDSISERISAAIARHRSGLLAKTQSGA